VESQAVTYEVAPCGCGCAWCDHCGPVIGWKLRKRLSLVVKRWGRAVMITLTVDPTLYPGGPQEAWRDVGQRRCIGRFMRALRARGLIVRDEYFCGLEFHKPDSRNGDMPHWHLLIDMPGRIDKGLLQDLWGTLRPQAAGPVVPGRPAYGVVWYTAAGQGHAAGVEEGSDKAVNYATKYLCKPPPEGLPDWVKTYTGRVHRYSVSQGFWKSLQPGDLQGREANGVGPLGHPLTCFCEVCRGEVEALATDDELAPADPGQVEQPSLPARTVAERLQACGKTVNLFRVVHKTLGDGREVREAEWLGNIPRSLGEVCADLGMECGDESKRVEMDLDGLCKLIEVERLVPGSFFNRSAVASVSPCYTLSRVWGPEAGESAVETAVSPLSPTSDNGLGEFSTVQPFAEFLAFATCPEIKGDTQHKDTNEECPLSISAMSPFLKEACPVY
jgi:hypothetical protein